MPPANYEVHDLYNGEVKVKFYPNSHRYQLEGEKTYLIGVTTACGMKDKSAALLIWASRLSRDYLLERIESGEPITKEDIERAVNIHKERKEEAADIGSQIHDWIETYVEGGQKERPPIPEDERVQLGIIAFLQWVEENKVEFIHNEKVVFSRKFEYVGKFDAIANVNGVETLIDYKSSKGIYLTMRYQTAAYLKAWNEEHGTDIKQRMILRLGKDDGAFQVATFNDEEQLEKDFLNFVACLTLKEHDKEEYNWQRQINS